MFELVVGPGVIGSPVDVATLFVVTAHLLYQVKPRLSKVSAAVVALARRDHRIDDEHLQHELDVDDRAVDALETTIVRTDGRESE